MNLAYCEKWWLRRKKGVNMLDPESAHQRHEIGQRYTALLGGASHPRFVVEMAAESVSVIFLDSTLRQYLRYDFQSRDGGRVFLKNAIFWDFEDDGESIASRKIFSFEESGQILMDDWTASTGESRELKAFADASVNWDAYPAFGDYLALCKEERVAR
jgi:hypothetical protein